MSDSQNPAAPPHEPAEEEDYEGETREYVMAPPPELQPPPAQPPNIPIPDPPQVGAPYRVPIAPEEPPPAPVAWQPVAKKPRPILGSAIALYGLGLWAFVVAGQFATSWISGTPIKNSTALFFVFVIVMTGWGFALQRSRHALPPPTIGRFIGRGIGIFALAFGFFVLTIMAATIFGQATYGHDLLIAFLLVATAAAAIIVGPRITTPVRPQLTHRMRFAIVCMWISGVLVTFIAGAELATNG